MVGFQRQTRVGDAASYWNAFRKDNSIIIQERTVIHPSAAAASPQVQVQFSSPCQCGGFLSLCRVPSVRSGPKPPHRTSDMARLQPSHTCHSNKVTSPSLTLGFASYHYNRFVLSRVTASSRGGLTSAHDK